MVREIVLVGDKILTTKAVVAWRGDKRVGAVLDDLRSTVRSAGGAGLAAPQIGVGMTCCVWVDREGKIQELVNPEIVKRSLDVVREYEACLSIPGKWGEVERHREIWVNARDRNWKEVRLRLRGFSARVVQHEVDHLAGVLFTSKVLGVLLDAEEYAEMRAAREAGELERAVVVGDEEPLLA